MARESARMTASMTARRDALTASWHSTGGSLSGAGARALPTPHGLFRFRTIRRRDQRPADDGAADGAPPSEAFVDLRGHLRLIRSALRGDLRI
jgi:hypothetical protein